MVCSHNGYLFDHRRNWGNWRGHLPKAEPARKAVPTVTPAGARAGADTVNGPSRPLHPESWRVIARSVPGRGSNGVQSLAAA